MNVFILLKRFLKMVERDLHCCARKLHTTVGRHISWTYKVHASDEALAACNRNLR
jgi:deoxycytidylate deaminase